MKKLTSLLLMVVMSITLVACGSGQNTGDGTGDNNNGLSQQSQSESPEAAEESEEPESNTEQSETVEPSDAEEGTEAEEGSDTQEVNDPEEAADTAEESSTTLVVYFSNTGNTKAIAESIANGIGADIYEIIAEVPYTEADLDYGDNNSRSTEEMNDPSVRPAITGSVENMEQYDTVYIGYPIWWGEAPRILGTFVESYDFTGKTVIPFCTSASSGMGSSASGLEELAGSGNWLSGSRFSGSESAETVMEWVNGL